jgi:hypothetical protein
MRLATQQAIQVYFPGFWNPEKMECLSER